MSVLCFNSFAAPFMEPIFLYRKRLSYNEYSHNKPAKLIHIKNFRNYFYSLNYSSLISSNEIFEVGDS